jgi:hypothetical protein
MQLDQVACEVGAEPSTKARDIRNVFSLRSVGVFFARQVNPE